MQTQDRKKSLVQVCESLANEQTKKREILALREAMEELGLNFSTIVTRNEEGNLTIEDKTIQIMPVWQFLLEWSV